MILFDESHNEFCGIEGLRKRRSYLLWKERMEPFGITAVSSRKAFLQEMKTYDILVIAEPHTYFNLTETQALFDYVLQGGSLVLIGNHHNTKRYYSYGCNEILNVFSKPFGIRFNDDEIRFFEDNILDHFADHPICEGITHIHFWRGCSLTLLRQGTVVRGVAYGSRHDRSEIYKKRPIAAALYEGEGKIFCLGDSSVWADPKKTFEDDNFTLAENVITWALG
jgi:hypothetical protein